MIPSQKSGYWLPEEGVGAQGGGCHGMVLGEEAFGMCHSLTLLVITWIFALQLFVTQYIYVVCICTYICYILQ